MTVEGVMWGIITLLMVGCTAMQVPSTSTPPPISTRTPCPTEIPSSTPEPTQELLRTCVGWQCSLEGAVYEGAARPGNEVAEADVRLSHYSHCSPTRGDHETFTSADGSFSFLVYVHDTDTFWIEVAIEGYEAVRQSIDGVDCLYCSCPPMEIVVQPE